MKEPAPGEPPTQPGSGGCCDWTSIVYVTVWPGGLCFWTRKPGVPRHCPGAAVSVAYSAARKNTGVCISVISTVGIRCDPCGADHAPQPSTPHPALDITAAN